MSGVLPGAHFSGHNHLAPCSLVLPHDKLRAYTDWSGNPTKRITSHPGLEPPQRILAQCQSSFGTYDVIVGKFDNDVLTMYFGTDGWKNWQSGIDLREPYKPLDIWVKLFFACFLCRPKANRVLIIGLGGGILPMLMRHYFPSIIIDVVEIDETVIELASDFFSLAEEKANGFLNIIADDAFRYVNQTAQKYDVIFLDAFLKEAMPAHINSCQFFTSVHHVLSNGGCLVTNGNLSTKYDFNRLVQGLSSTFEANILLAHNILVEDARVIISGSQSSLLPISSKERAIQEAQWFQSDVHLEFNLSKLLSLAYRGQVSNNESQE
ncbi:unnamed protein product [Rotaria sp. Silwood2]|nr:unnamed protein product [Rotaria sp. Silwood2]CAF4511683.1 unnamed protein product [Rotaria sp. Silwood2]